MLMRDLILYFSFFVAFLYLGGNQVPKLLRDNKEILTGVFLGLFIGWFPPLRNLLSNVEGVKGNPPKHPS